MPGHLPSKPIISRDALCEIGATRIREAKALLDAGYYAGAVYLGGYAVECYLKAAICYRLRWDHMLGTFKTHDLDTLIHYTGLEPDLRENSTMLENFRQVVGIWDISGDDSVRYRVPSEFDEPTANSFLRLINDPTTGVVPWLRRMMS